MFSRLEARRDIERAGARRVALWCALVALLISLACAGSGCRRGGSKQSVRPRTLRDVPAERLAYRFEADTTGPRRHDAEDPNTKLPSIQADFDARRKDDALVRTVLSPDGKRALALYETGDAQPGEFRIDMYGADGNFVRNVTPADLTGAFAPTVTWSSDGNYIAFIGRRSATPSPSPAPPDAAPEEATTPDPTASVAPFFAPVQVFNTEQIYVCNRDGYDLKALTAREGLIYFYLGWAPDNHALVSLACREDEWEARANAHLQPAGRPRIIEMSGQERLLDDALADALPVWSPDSSKVAAAFDTDVGIYDAITNTPTSARIQLRAPLLAASVAYDEKNLRAKNSKAGNAGDGGTSGAQTRGAPVSFSPIVQLEWPRSDTLFVQTGFVRIYSNETVTNLLRWHTLHLSPQAALLS